MTLTKRIAVFVAFWLLAGVVYAVFSDVTVEAGDSLLDARFAMVYLAPLAAASGMAFTFVPSDHEVVVSWLIVVVFCVHAIIALTRRNRRQFMALTMIQVLFLVVSVPCVLYFFHYEATHGHG